MCCFGKYSDQQGTRVRRLGLNAIHILFVQMWRNLPHTASCLYWRSVEARVTNQPMTSPTLDEGHTPLVQIIDRTLKTLPTIEEPSS